MVISRSTIWAGAGLVEELRVGRNKFPILCGSEEHISADAGSHPAGTLGRRVLGQSMLALGLLQSLSEASVCMWLSLAVCL